MYVQCVCVCVCVCVYNVLIVVLLSACGVMHSIHTSLSGGVCLLSVDELLSVAMATMTH